VKNECEYSILPDVASLRHPSRLPGRSTTVAYRGNWKDSSGVKVALNARDPESPELRLSASPVHMRLMRNPVSLGLGTGVSCSPVVGWSLTMVIAPHESTSDFSHSLLDIGVTVSISAALPETTGMPVRSRSASGLGIAVVSECW
jgi:hypothetical protein